MVEHADLTGVELHEPKGAAAANNHELYAADGAGSGTWRLITKDSIDDTSILNRDRFWLHCTIPDVSTSDTIYVPVPFDAGSKTVTLVSATLVLGNAITVANAAVTFRNSSGTSMGTAVTITQAGSAAGDVFTFSPTSNDTFATGAAMRIETDGGSTTAAPLHITLELTIA